MSKIIYLIDRSRVETRENCPRKRYLQYDYDGTGLEPEAGSLPLLSGIAIHAAHARILAGQDIEAVIHDIIAGYKKELAERGLLQLEATDDLIKDQSALLEGMLRMWALVRMPRILQDFDVESIEEAHDWELAPGLVQRMRKDAILRRKDDGLRFILDYKTVKAPTEVWFEKFEHNRQTCDYILSEKERTGEPVGGILYEGLVKGAYRKDTAQSSPFYGRRIQHSPYTIAYRIRSNGLELYQTDYTSKKGWEKVRTFEQMPMKEWVEKYLRFERETVNNLFIAVPDICPPDYELQRMRDQKVREELEYFERLERFNRIEGGLSDNAREELADTLFPYRTEHCFKYGEEHKCAFLSVCFNRGARPLEDGGFVRRVPHHDTDLKMTT